MGCQQDVFSGCGAVFVPEHVGLFGFGTVGLAEGFAHCGSLAADHDDGTGGREHAVARACTEHARDLVLVGNDDKAPGLSVHGSRCGHAGFQDGLQLFFGDRFTGKIADAGPSHDDIQGRRRAFLGFAGAARKQQGCEQDDEIETFHGNNCWKMRNSYWGMSFRTRYSERVPIRMVGPQMPNPDVM